MNFIFEYTRIVCYLIIIISSFISLQYKKYHSFLLIGDIIFSIFTISALLNITIFYGDKTITNNYYITPAVIIWAGFHFSNLLKSNGRY